MVFGREPAFWLGLIGSVLVGILHQLVGAGLITPDTAQTMENLVTTLVPFIVTIILRQMVTPVLAPKLPEGTPVEVTDKSTGETLASVELPSG